MATKKPGSVFHKLLAVVHTLELTADNFIKEGINTFGNKQSHFDGMKKIYTPYTETSDDGNNKLPVENIPDEITEIVTSVEDKLKFIINNAIEGIDTSISKEASNASNEIKAELNVDGESFGTFSTIELLNLETWLGRIRKLYNNIPTLDPKREWAFNKDTGFYKTKAVPSFRTLSRPRALTMAKATDKHAEQVKLIDLTTEVGQWLTTYSSGRVYPKTKSDLLSRIDKLITAVKVAKAAANSGPIYEVKIAKRIFDFINGDAFSSQE